MGKHKVSSLRTISLNSFLEKKDRELRDRYEKEYIDLYVPVLGNLVQFHKACLGKHTFCFTTERRYWVWKDKKWCIYVNNEAGAQFEIDPSCSIEEAWEMWTEFRRKMSKKDQAPSKD